MDANQLNKNNTDRINNTNNANDADNDTYNKIDSELDKIDREIDEYNDRKNTNKKSNKTTQYPAHYCTTDIYFKIERYEIPKEMNNYLCTDFDDELNIYQHIFAENKKIKEIKYDKTRFSNDTIIEMLEKYKKDKVKKYSRYNNDITTTYTLPVTHSVWINKANKISKDFITDTTQPTNFIKYVVTSKDSHEVFDNSYSGRCSPEWKWSRDPRPKGSGKLQIKKDMKYNE